MPRVRQRCQPCCPGSDRRRSTEHIEHHAVSAPSWDAALQHGSAPWPRRRHAATAYWPSQHATTSYAPPTQTPTHNQNILRQSYDKAKVTIALRQTSNLQNILRRMQDSSYAPFTCTRTRLTFKNCRAHQRQIVEQFPGDFVNRFPVDCQEQK